MSDPTSTPSPDEPRRCVSCGHVEADHRPGVCLPLVAGGCNCATFHPPAASSPDERRQRNRYLLTTEVDLLRAWGRDLARLFNEGPYLVGSALQRQDWRDVDVRIMLDDDRFDALVAICNPKLLNLSLSLWGQKVTGLPIDCQVQRVTDANAEFNGPRDPLHLPADHFDPWTPAEVGR